MVPPSVKPRPWLTHPVRLSGFTALAVLLGPGSLMGLSMLLAHAGAGGFLPGALPRVHALLQCVGFFLVLIWGFLVHGLPGMLAADPQRTARMRIPMVLTGLGSRGLLYHGLFAKMLAQAILEGDEGHFPQIAKDLLSKNKSLAYTYACQRNK